MRIIYIFIIGLFFSGYVLSNESNLAKGSKRKYNEAEFFMGEGAYDYALPILLELEQKDKGNPNLLYKIGVCLLNMREGREKALPYLQSSIQYVTPDYNRYSHKERRVPPEAHIYLGIAHRMNHDFDKSMESFDNLSRLIQSHNIDDLYMIEYLERERQITKNAINYINNPVDIPVYNADRSLNSSFSDHSAVLTTSGDKIYFTSKRAHNPRNGPRLIESIFVSDMKDYQWQVPRLLNYPVNTENNHEATICLTGNDSCLVFLRTGPKDHLGGLYISEKKDNHNWTEPKIFHNLLKSSNRETHCGNVLDQDIVFFTSRRKKGYGGTDIYVIRKLPDGKWSQPRLLPENINTPFDEETPFFAPDQQTLYFSSKGHNTMGGFDVFSAKMNPDGTFQDPVNLGYPINSTDDDVSFFLTEHGNRGYFSSIREDGYGDIDLYEFFIGDVFNKNLVVIYNGFVYNNESQPITDFTLKVYDDETEELIGVYNPHSVNNCYFLLKPNVKNRLVYTANGYKPELLVHTPNNNEYNAYIYNSNPLQFKDVFLSRYFLSETLYYSEKQVELTDQSIATINSALGRVENQLGSSDLHVIISEDSTAETEDMPYRERRKEIISDYLVNKGLKRSNIYTGESYPDDMHYEILNLTLVIEPDMESTKQIVEIENILFDFDRYNIKQMYVPNLDVLVSYMKNNPSARIEINGHTDDIGTSEYNLNLSYNRANSVKQYLLGKGVNEANISIKRHGKADPVVPNRTPQGVDLPSNRQLNRRVEIRVVQQGDKEILKVKDIL